MVRYMIALMQAATTHERMLGSGNDSPMVLSEGLFSNGNFESTVLALASDPSQTLHYIAWQYCQPSEFINCYGESLVVYQPHYFLRREFRNGMFLNNLSRTLSAMVAEISSLAFPSAFSSSSQITAGMDDYQSHAPTSLQRMREQIPMMKRILAIEALTAVRAIEYRGGTIPVQLAELYDTLLLQAHKLLASGARTVVANWLDEFPLVYCR